MNLFKILLLITLSCLGSWLIYFLKDRKYNTKKKNEYFKEREKERDNWFK